MFGHGLEAGDAVVGGLVGEEDAVGLFVAAADATTELVELGEAEAVGMFDDHGGGVGDVDADFDDGGGDEDVDEVLAEAFHDVLAGLLGEAAVDEADAEILEEFGLEFFLDVDGVAEGGGDILDFRFSIFDWAFGVGGIVNRGGGEHWFVFDGGDDDVGLLAGFESGGEPFVDFFAAGAGGGFGEDGLAAGGSSSMTETSRSPKAVMARVRGMGVAVMTRVWGAPPPPSRRVLCG